MKNFTKPNNFSTKNLFHVITMIQIHHEVIIIPRICVDVDDELYVTLYSKYGNVNKLILSALQQLASTTSTTYSVLADIQRLQQLCDIIFSIERQVFRIISSLATRAQMSKAEIPTPFREIIDTTLALRIQILYDMLKRLQKLRIPPVYRRKISELMDKCRWLLIELRYQKKKDREYSDYTATEVEEDVESSENV